MIETEQGIIGKILNNPLLLEINEVRPEWFGNPEHREIIKTLAEIRSFSEYSEIVVEAKRSNPYTKLSHTAIEKLTYKEGHINDLETSLHLLKMNYLESQIEIASSRYQQSPTESNQEALFEAINNKKMNKIVTPKKDMNEALDRFEYKQNNKIDIKFVKTFKRLDYILTGGFSGGRLTTIGGRSGTGKTTFAINLAVNAMKNVKGVRIDFFTIEMSEDQMIDKFISCVADVNSSKLVQPFLSLNEAEQDRVTKAREALRRSNLIIHDDLEDIDDICMQIKRRSSEEAETPYIAVIDYIGLVRPRNINIPRNLQIGEMSREIKAITKEFNIPIIMLSQTNRGSESNEKPTMSSLKESGSLEEDSNAVMLLYKDKEDEGVIWLNVDKNREGMTGEIDYRFIKEKTYFEELPYER